MKRIAIVQSNYIPWRGYFDMIRLVDEFVILDTVQFTKNDWRNRNRIPSAKGGVWLTIPCRTAGQFGQRIDETEVTDGRWARKHWETIRQSYARAPHVAWAAPRIEALYTAAANEVLLSKINLIFLRGLCEMLGVTTPITHAEDFDVEDKTERVVRICQSRGAAAYLSGPAARAYADEAQFTAAGIALEYMDYAGYPEYPQLTPGFDPAVSVVDLLFNVGPGAMALLTRQVGKV